MRIKIAHGLFPRARWVFVRHCQHLLDECGNSPRLFGLFFPSDRVKATVGVVTRHRGADEPAG
jgi:hypothetical protein